MTTATVEVDPGRRPSGEPTAERAARPARLVRAATAHRGAARRDLHRVLGDLLPVRRGVALDRDVLPGGLRAAAARPRRVRGAAPPRPAAGAQSIRLAALAGVFFTGDLMFWHHAIEAVGAGLATVLGNLQVIIVGFFAWLLLGERPSRATLLALPVVLAGVVLISGVVGADRVRREPAARGHPRDRDRDLLLRLPAADPARRPRPAPPGRARWRSRRRSWCCARSSLGEAIGDLDLTPGLDSLFWLALLGITVAVGRLPADLDLAAAAAGDHHLDHPADPAGHVDGPGDGPAR